MNAITSQSTLAAALAAQPEISAPGAVPQLQRSVNDVRLPSHAARPPLGLGLPSHGSEGAGLSPPEHGEAVTLGAVARAVCAILDSASGRDAHILGLTPLWPQAQPPLVQRLAATLSDTVANSGLFYESHLRQYAAGTRSLTQLAQEPQARFGSAARLASGQDAAPIDFTQPSSSVSASSAPQHQALLMPGIHPDTVALVRQQLELLAQPAFRWAGEAWPGVAMDWEIQQRQESTPDGADPASQRSWATRLALTLPRLGALELRLSLTGNTLTVQLQASQEITRALLNDGRDELVGRLADDGLELVGWQTGVAPGGRGHG